MTLAYVAHLGLKAKMTNIDIQKIDRFSLATHGMVIALFQIVNKLVRSYFFQEICLLVNISMKIVLGISFLALNNADIQFAEKDLTWRTYTTTKTLSTTCQVKIIN